MFGRMSARQRSKLIPGVGVRGAKELSEDQLGKVLCGIIRKNISGSLQFSGPGR